MPWLLNLKNMLKKWARIGNYLYGYEKYLDPKLCDRIHKTISEV